MRELQVNKVLPIIDANFDEVKASLNETLAKYRGIVVTEELIKDCKATQKDLAKIRNSIESYRKLIKKEMTEPISVFEGSCKELVGLIAEVEAPIKEGIAVFDEKRRQEKVKYAMDTITIAITEYGLNDKYSKQLSIHDVKITLTNSLKSIKEEINSKAEYLKNMQVLEEEKRKNEIETIHATVSAANEGYESKLSLDKYLGLYEKNWTLQEVVRVVNSDRKMIEAAARKAIEAENKRRLEEERKAALQLAEKEDKKEAIIPKEVEEVAPAPTNNSETNIKNESEKDKCFYTLKITHSMDHMRMLANYLKSNGFTFEKLDEGWVTNE